MKRLEFNKLLNVAKWLFNHCTITESLSEEMFINHYGSHEGKHFYQKWINYCKQNVLEMIAYFGTEADKGQIFCDMLMQQVDKYTKRT